MFSTFASPWIKTFSEQLALLNLGFCVQWHFLNSGVLKWTLTPVYFLKNSKTECVKLHVITYLSKEKKKPTAAAGVMFHSNTYVLPAPPTRLLHLHSHEFCRLMYSYHFWDLCRIFRLWSLYAKAIWLKHWKKRELCRNPTCLGQVAVSIIS